MLQKLDKVVISENEPTPLIRDFKLFINYLQLHNVALTPTNEHLSRKKLYEINKVMTDPNKDNTPRTDQKFYPRLHLFYHLVLSGKLFKKVPGEKGRLMLKETNRLQLFHELSPVEQYFFLLETFWVDTDWDELKSDYFGYKPSNEVDEVLIALGKQKPYEKILLGRRRDDRYFAEMMYRWGYFFLYFSYFGFWDVTRNQKKGQDYPKGYFQARSITPQPLGIRIGPVLGKTRRLINWNVHERCIYGEWDAEPGSPSIYGEQDAYVERMLRPSFLKDESMIIDEGEPGDLFFSSFTHFFKNGELEKTIPREKKKFVDGTYILKVSLPGRIWRRIEISSKHTLLDLHECIQNAFDFDDDHLYSFFMDNKPWSKNRFVSPYDEGSPYVDEVRIGELGLFEGKKFLYLFDYGTSWHFQVKVEKIHEKGSKPKKPRVIKIKGKAPDQYFDDEDNYFE